MNPFSLSPEESKGVIDSFAWVEVLRDSAAGARVVREIEGADDCFTASISLAEVPDFGFRHGLTTETVLQQLVWIGEASHVVEVEPSLAVAAAQAADELRARAKARRLPRPGLADGLVLATARHSRSRILTGDQHFKGLPETIWLPSTSPNFP